MPNEVNGVEINQLLDKLLHDDTPISIATWRTNILSSQLLRLTAIEYARLPRCLQKKCLLDAQDIYILQIDYEKNILLQQDFFDWQAAYDVALKFIDDLKQHSTSNITGFKVKRKTRMRDGITKYNYYVILNDRHNISDIIRVLPGPHLGTGTYGKVRLGLSSNTGELLALKIQTAITDVFTDLTVAMIQAEQEVLSLRKQLFGIIERNGRHDFSRQLVRKAILCMPYYLGQSADTALHPAPSITLSVWQKNLFLLQTAIEIFRLHRYNIAHFDIKPQNFQLDVINAAERMLKANLFDFGSAANVLLPVVARTFTRFYGAPELCYYFIFGKSKIDNIAATTINSHEFRVLQKGSGCPPGLFSPTNTPAGLLADVYAFGNMLFHDCDLTADFVAQHMLNPNPSLRPSMQPVIFWLLHYFINYSNLDTREVSLLTALAMHCEDVDYEDLRDSIFALDRVLASMPIKSQSDLLLKKCALIYKMQELHVVDTDIHVCFLTLRLNQLQQQLYLIKSRIPNYSSLYLLFHRKQKEDITMQNKQYLEIQSNIDRSLILLQNTDALSKRESKMVSFLTRSLAQLHDYDLMQPRRGSVAVTIELQPNSPPSLSPLPLLPAYQAQVPPPPVALQAAVPGPDIRPIICSSINTSIMTEYLEVPDTTNLPQFRP